MRHVISTNPYPRAWLQLPPTHVLTESKIPHPVNTATRSYDEAAARVILNARDGAGCDAPPPKKKKQPTFDPDNMGFSVQQLFGAATKCFFCRKLRENCSLPVRTLFPNSFKTALQPQFTNSSNPRTRSILLRIEQSSGSTQEPDQPIDTPKSHPTKYKSY